MSVPLATALTPDLASGSDVDVDHVLDAGKYFSVAVVTPVGALPPMTYNADETTAAARLSRTVGMSGRDDHVELAMVYPSTLAT